MHYFPFFFIAVSMDCSPWAVETLDKFMYFQCPECEDKCRAKQDLVNHAFHKHSESAGALYNHLKDADITLPAIKDDQVKSEVFETEDIKNEEPSCLDEDDEEEVPIYNKYVKKITRSFKCSECISTFQTSDRLRFHLLKAHKTIGSGVTVQRLPTASVKKADKKLNSKLKKIKEKEEDSKGTEMCLCSLCGKTLIGRSNFKKHEREKHGIDNIHRKRIVKPLKMTCQKCSIEFEDLNELNLHVTKCEGDSKEFPCPKCSSTWASGPVLNLHLKKDHKVGEMYTCSICGKCFKRKISVDSHIKVEHENIKDHVCHLCGAGFARAQALRFHIQRIHEHSGRYACEYCDFKTVAQLKLDIHVNEVHTKAIKYPCRDCNFICYRKGGLLAHIKTVHLKLKPHECPHCPEAFVRRKELEKHRQAANH